MRSTPTLVLPYRHIIGAGSVEAAIARLKVQPPSLVSIQPPMSIEEARVSPRIFARTVRAAFRRHRDASPLQDWLDLLDWLAEGFDLSPGRRSRTLFSRSHDLLHWITIRGLFPDDPADCEMVTDFEPAIVG